MKLFLFSMLPAFVFSSAGAVGHPIAALFMGAIGFILMDCYADLKWKNKK